MKRKLLVGFVYSTVLSAMLLVAVWGDRAVTAMSERAPLPSRTCIIIDAGHGLPDGGAVSCTGVYESVLNLEISQRLEDLLHLLGYDTKMLRTSPNSIYTEGNTIAQKKVSDLKERVRMVNETEQGILLSIHQNHYPDSRYSGAQMFYADTPGSEDLAIELQKSFSDHLGSRRQAKPCPGIYLMTHVNCTAVLVECGFLSNPGEEASLRDGEYQKKICCVIASAVSNYLTNT